MARMKINVRRLEANDLATRVLWLNNPIVYKSMTIDAPISVHDTQIWFSKNALSVNRREFTFVIKNNDQEEKPVAMGGLLNIDYHHSNAELYIMVCPELNGKGIGRLSVAWICNYGFLNLNLNKIYLYTLSTNHRAIRLYERIGFFQEGTMRLHIRQGNEYIDRYIYSMLRSEWERQQWHTNELLLEVTYQ